MLDLLRGFLEPIFQFIPRLSRRPSSIERCIVDGVLGVRESRCPQVYIEMLTHVEFYPAVPQPLDLEQQTLFTADGIEITVNCTCSVLIVDPLTLRAIMGQDEAMFNASIVIRRVVSEFLMARTLEDGLAAVRDGQLLRDIDAAIAEASQISLKITRFAIEDIAKTTSRRHYGLNSQNLVVA